MPDKNTILNILGDKEEEMLVIRLMANVNVTAIRLDEYVKVRLLQGATKKEIEKELLGDLLDGGRIFGEFRKSIQATADGSIKRTADIGQWAFEGVEKQMRWVTVEDKKVCPDCRPRHNRVKTLEAWEVLGLPGTGWSICRDNCRCVIVDSELELPVIKRERKQ